MSGTNTGVPDPNDWSDQHFYTRMQQALARRLREHRFDVARGALVELLQTRRHPIADLCLALEDQQVEVLGWHAIQALALAPERGSGRLPDALQLNYSGQGDFAGESEAVRWEDGSTRRLGADCWPAGVEVSMVSSERIDFATAGLDEIAAAKPIGAAWPGTLRGGATLMILRGLERLRGAINRTWEYPELPPPGTLFLASWYFAVRFHAAIGHAIAEQGLPRPIPVVVGFNDCEPNVTVAHRPRLNIHASPVPPRETGTHERDAVWLERIRAKQEQKILRRAQLMDPDYVRREQEACAQAKAMRRLRKDEMRILRSNDEPDPLRLAVDLIRLFRRPD